MSTLGQASTAALAQYLRLAAAQGLAPMSLLRQAGLDPALLDDDKGRISGEMFQQFLQELLQQLPSPILGLRSGDYVQPSSYNVLGHISMSCTTLGEIIERIAPYEKLVGDMGTTQIITQGSETQVRWRCNYPDAQVREQMVDNIFSSWIHYARWLGNTDAHHPLRVELERSAPAPQWLTEYQQRWHCPVLFDQAANIIVLDNSLLALPLRQGDSDLRHTLEQHAQTKLAQLAHQEIATSASELIPHVRSLIRQNLALGDFHQEHIAAQLHLSVRTLQRKLEQLGTHFKELLDLERQQQAEHLLQHSQHSTFDIAAMLGFSELSSFHRSFKRWTGKTPKEFKGAVR